MTKPVRPLSQAVTGGAGGAGRMCPADYRYAPDVFCRAPDFNTDILYVVGGLYGNVQALDALERLVTAEEGPFTIVFNGDFHWFDADPDWFAEIETRVGTLSALRGNVETETARTDDIGAGCGCAYPASVDDGLVQRSNAILRDLRAVAADDAAVPARLAALPMHYVVGMGDIRVGIVHGDAYSLAGWRFAQDALDTPDIGRQLAALKSASNIDIFASTHTCLAALRHFRTPHKALTIINNGAAGMPNFRNSRFGVVTRIATRPSPHRPLYGLRHGDIHVDALPLAYDHEAFLSRFLRRWPPGSPAHTSYFRRIMQGPDYDIAIAGEAGELAPA
jgi:hypothetical protein